MGTTRRTIRSLDPEKAERADARWWRDAQQEFGCWEWQGSINDDGYGTIWNGEQNVLAHRYGWILVGQVIPEGMELDHVCRNTRCVKPVHQELVTHATNLKRRPPSEFCRKGGHALVPGNVYRYPKSGARLCVTCHPERKPNWFPEDHPEVKDATGTLLVVREGDPEWHQLGTRNDDRDEHPVDRGSAAERLPGGDGQS